MKMMRLILVLLTVALLGASLTGCLKQNQPHALFRATQSEEIVPFTVSFDGTLSFVREGAIVSYVWAFVDGSTDSGPLVDHTYQEDGTYEARLTVTDELGVSSTTTMTIQALNPPPTAGFIYSPRSNADGTLIVSCSEEITFEAADYCADDGEIISYEWYFGYRNEDGTAATATGPTVTHEFMEAGAYTIVLTVTDNDGGTDQYKETLDVRGGPPCPGDTDWGSGGGTCG